MQGHEFPVMIQWKIGTQGGSWHMADNGWQQVQGLLPHQAMPGQFA